MSVQSNGRRWWILAGFAAVAIVLPSVASAQAVAVPDTAQDRWVIKAVTSLLDTGHLTKHPLDDEISKRGLNNYIKTLDPAKRFFLQSDIDEFKQWETTLDDKLKNADISPAAVIFDRFLKRLDERVTLVRALAKEKHDFTQDDFLDTDNDKIAWCKTEAEIAERWRLRVKYDMLSLQTDGRTEADAVEKLVKRFDAMGRRMKATEPGELFEWYMTALTTAYDPHTTFMSPDTGDDFQIAMRLQLEGIGAALSNEDGVTTVSRVVPGGPAFKEGSLKKKDVVVAVGEGNDGAMVDISDKKLKNVVKMIRGQGGTIVRLEVVPHGQAEHKVIKITRGKVELEESAARSEVIEEGQKPDGKPFRIGVIDLPSFYMDMSGSREDSPDFRSTTRDCRKIIEKFKEQHVDAIIIDVRRNGGGALVEAIDLTGLFIDTGPVVQVKGPDGKSQAYDDREPGVVWDGPLVVMISKFSASASEIFAGAIQDYHRGLVIGDTATHGKGTVQSLIDIGRQLIRGPRPPKVGSLKMTMQQFYRPNGESTQKRGVLADVELPSITTHLDTAEDRLDYAVEFEKIDAAQFKAYNLVTPAVVEQLRALSKARRGQSEDFKKAENRIAKFIAQRDRKLVPLNAAKFKAEREELDAEEETLKQEEELDNPDRPVVERNYYFNEALGVTLDYMRLAKPVATR